MSEDAMDIAYSEQYEADLEWHKKALAYAKDQLRMEYAESDAMREELQTLRDERDRLRANLINCSERLAAYYGDNYPAVVDARAALTPGGQRLTPNEATE